MNNRFWYYLFKFGSILGEEACYAILFTFLIWNVDSVVGRRVFLVGYLTFYIGQVHYNFINYLQYDDDCAGSQRYPPLAATSDAGGCEDGAPVGRRVRDALDPRHDGHVTAALHRGVHRHEAVLAHLCYTWIVSLASIPVHCYSLLISVQILFHPGLQLSPLSRYALSSGYSSRAVTLLSYITHQYSNK